MDNFAVTMISIVIPVLNVAEYLPAVLTHTLSLKGNFEVIAVDGGSTDNSLGIIKSFENVKWAKSPKGRSHQMNKGAGMAIGDILLFLHADTLLPKNGLELISETLQDKKKVGGSFYLTFDHQHWLLSLYSSISKINHSFFTYGDHAIFVRKSVFEKIGGYKPLHFMEDIEIQSRLRKAGKFVKLQEGVTTSARRFVKNGVIKQFLSDVFLVALYKIGFSANWLKRFYQD